MNVNKKLGRLRQYAKERMGGEAATTTTDDFKMLEMEMDLRHTGMDRLQQSSNAYVKSLSKRDQGEGKEKQLAVGNFGSTLASHGDDFEPDSEFGQCLMGLGRANERISRMQETYCANATSSWLESVERSMIQMKEYQAARKKLESRRLAYDTASAKMQKSKKEDFRMEEELRSQKAKYEESNEEVYRRMLDIKEAEVDSVADLTSFLEAELTYYDRCREVLLQLKKEWPAQAMVNRSDTSSPVNGYGRRNTLTRSRASSVTDRFSRIAEDEPLEPPPRPTISSRSASGTNSPRRELPGFDLPVRPANGRITSGFEGPTSLARDQSPQPMPRLSRVPTEPTQIIGARNGLRVTKRDSPREGVFADDQSDYSDSPSTYEPRRSMSWSTAGNDGSTVAKKPPPPPPPPSRSKKPAPPLPLKRSALSTSEVPGY
ncbi:hypothetical protein LTR37_007114 [Vermiconidia calcicola]|uniref:Uncharacterized protein n=1 Tax=Vermiconidia calcicola TaxID=1690605 RepID=A0ACC3NE89_9PEZI|nr:hypothetical protein LTR37_007114 [Vermiconidia calcicola]